MTYLEAIAWLEGLGRFGMRPGLDTSKALAQAAGNPERGLTFIHVAGTNGKGSTCAFLEAMLRTAGFRTGLYTSPHLIRFGERIQVRRKPIPDQALIDGVEKLRHWIPAILPAVQPTFFEATTVLALDYFRSQSCDVVVWETGLGGRLDATNIVTPAASVITTIGLDHQAWLGDTLEKIAAEKAGIIKPGIPIVSAVRDETPHEVIRETAARMGAPFRRVTASDVGALPSTPSLSGEHQHWNAATAWVTLQELAARFRVPRGAVTEGLRTTEWHGRQQWYHRNGQTWLIDGAHNVQGVQSLVHTLDQGAAGGDPVLLTGMLGDKSWREMAGLLAPHFRRVKVVPVGSERAVPPDSLVNAFRQARPDVAVTVASDLRHAVESLRQERRIVATGSLYFIGELLALLDPGNDGRTEHRLNEYRQP